MKWLAVAALVGAAACGELLEAPVEDAGRPCLGDEDCVPDGCCGRGIWSIHVEDAPSCGGETCDGQCDVTQVRCGCGLPVCRDSHCSIAVAVDPMCE